MEKIVKLRLQKTVKVKPSAPFAFDSTFHKPDHFASNDNHWEPGVRWQTLNWRDVCLGIKFSNKGVTETPLLEIKIFSENKIDDDFIGSLVGEIKYRYNLEFNLAEFYEMFANDKILAPIISKWRGMKPGHSGSLYEYLIIGIVLQNTIIKRSIQMLDALYQSYGMLLEFDGKKLWCFWSPGGLVNATEEDLRVLKVGYRAKAIKRIDDCFARGVINENILRKENGETQKDELLKIYGVGPATVWYLLFDVFHHYDFFNHISPWEQKIYSKLFFDQDLENPVAVDKLMEYFERYGEYKQLAVHYIWEDLWWRRKDEKIEWLEKLIRA
jgi:3-methyladenine DNA glycosylase/8-oxoguanine DNA glycosylase